ncbi:MAG: hypothetical protein ACE5OS_07355 [Anaerolineae bacterium]
MLIGWQNSLKANPFPWLLEQENPSARYLTLRHLLDHAEQDSQVSEARAAIPTWPPVQEILALMDPVDFWGRADRPFYGGAVGTHATLNLLAELGMPHTPQLEAACQNIFEHGQHESGGFTYDGTPGRIFLCYTGNAIRTLVHFGYRGDPRLERALEYLTTRSTTPGGLACPYADGEECQWGITKALGAFSALPAADRTPDRMHAIETLADAILDHEFDFEGRDACWLDFGFPLDYQSDLVELCDVLARLDYGTDSRLGRLLDIVLAAQTADGRWLKRYGTRAFQLEKRGQLSKWITIHALRAIKHTHRAIARARL